jgi:hypothetical protein
MGTHSVGRDLPLFTKFSDESDDRPPPDDFANRSPYNETYEEDDDFILDCDILHTPALTAASDDESKATSDISITHPAPIHYSNSKSLQMAPVGIVDDGKENVDLELEEQDDDMNELDAWLNSGAVEIVG